MSAVLKPTLATYADVLALPENLTGELIHGALHTQPRPSPKHARSISGLGGTLVPPFDFGDDGPGGWIILDEPECHLDGHVLVPDLAGWRQERLPQFPDTPYFTTVPDWACEVLSLSTARKDKALKLPLYGRLGVPYCWLVDPEARTLEAYASHAGVWTLLGVWADDAEARIPPFEAISLKLARLWV